MSEAGKFDISTTVDGGIRIKAEDDTIPIVIQMTFYGYGGLVCVTTIDTLQNARKVARATKRNDQFRMMLRVQAALALAYQNIDEIYEEQGERWADMMDDCILLAVYMESLFKRTIPLGKLERTKVANNTE